MRSSIKASYVLYLAVLPVYRTKAIGVLRESIGDRLALFCSAAHLEPTVKTGIPRTWYTQVRIVRVGRLLFIQIGGLRQALSASTTVLDLNPRSVTSVLILLSRRILRRRTLLWGHLDSQPRNGMGTQPVRSKMRELADGLIVYDYASADRLRAETKRPVWVAPNSLYFEHEIEPAFETTHGGQSAVRKDIIYVGRFEGDKNVDFLLKVFSVVAPEIDVEAKLILVGDGSERSALVAKAAALGLSDRVVFTGSIADPVELRKHYRTAFASLSPGYAGLQITQSLGFGVPILIPDQERHSPEVELEGAGGVYRFAPNDAKSAGQVLALVRADPPDPAKLSEAVRVRYSAERMAAGLEAALLNNISR